MEHKHETVNLGKTQGEKKTAFVVLFSAATMVLEIFFGLFPTQWLCLPMASTWGRTFWQSV